MKYRLQTLRAARAPGPGSISPISQAFPSSICASKQSIPILQRTIAVAASSSIGRACRGRAIATKDFIPGGTTLSDINFQVVKRIGKDLEVNGNFIYEHWLAPIYPSGTPTSPGTQQTVTSTTIQLTWFPKNKLSF